MTLEYGSRIFETSTTQGTGTLNLAGAVAGYQTFVDGTQDGAKVPYYIFDDTQWEHGVGTVTAGSPDTLSRDHVVASSSGTSTINWGTGTRNVILSPSPELQVWRDENLNDVSAVGSSGGTGNAHTVTMSPVPVAYSDKMKIIWKAPAANTGAITVNVNSLGAKSFVNNDGSDFISGQIPSGSLQEAFFDESADKFVKTSQVGGSGTFHVTGTSSAAASLSLAEDTDNGTHKLIFQAPASLSADVTATGPTESGTLAIVLPSCKLYQTTGTSVTIGTWTTLLFDTEAWDDAGWHSTSSNTDRITFDFTGRVQIIGVYSPNTANNTSYGTRILKNGTVVARRFSRTSDPAAENLQEVLVCEVDVVPTDYIQLQGYNSNGTVTSATGISGTTFSARRTK